MDVFGIAAASYGIVMALSPVLQINRMIKRRSSEDVSIGYFSVLTVGFLLWIAYGVSKGDEVLIIPNSFATAVSVITIAVALRFRTKGADQERSTFA